MIKTNLLDELTLEQKIGQMLCLGWGGADAYCNVNEQARRCVTELHAGGMIVMGRNVSPSGVKPVPPIDAARVRAMLDELQSLATVPLLVPTDQEGGRVARFGSAPFTRLPSAQSIGQAGEEAAHDAAQVIGQELRAVGVNWNFAPVADINSNPANPVIGDRAFGSDVDTVQRSVVAQVRGYADAGVLACVKHFPGHGDTNLDSHFALPTLSFSKAEMHARELAPFAAAIAADVPTVMTAHIVFPALDPALPATLSHAILTDLLRGEMGFDGLIVTDCLEMKAVADGWGTAQAALKAAQAGADMLLICHTWERQREAFDLLVRAAQTGELPLERIDQAVARVLAAKAKLPSTHPTGTDIPSPLALGLRKLLALPDATDATTLGAEPPR